MKKIFAALLSALLLVFACVGLAGCSKYTSAYSATTLVKIDNVTSHNLSFGSLKGRYVINLSSDGEGAIAYTASLEEGSATVYYDYDNRKLELFTINGGQSLENTAGYVEEGIVYVIIETDGTCRGGHFEFKAMP